MLINYFDKYTIDTENIKEKLDIISKFDTENASFITQTFKNAIEYLFSEEKLNANNLFLGIPKSLDKNTIVILFDNSVEDQNNEYLLEIEKKCKYLIIIGNHKAKLINNKIYLYSIKHISKIKGLLKDSKIEIGFNIQSIDNDSYYYSRMRNYFLNLLNKIDKLPIDSLERDVEGECTKLLLDDENFESHHYKQNGLIKMRNMIIAFNKIINYYSNKENVNENIFYINNEGKNNFQKINLLNSLSELVWLYYNKNKKERYSYAYDKICTQMLEEVKKIDYCFFVNNTCVTARNTNNSFPNSKENGCCNNTYKDKKKNCRYLKDDHSCSICSISCRVFTCGYLQKRGIDHSLWQYPLVDCIFSKLSRPNIIYGFFTPKEKMLEKIK